MTKEEAETYMAEMADVELDSDALKNVAGGVCYMAACNDDCSAKTPTLLGGNPY